MSKQAHLILQAVTQLFPNETKGYEKLILDSVEHIIESLPENMTVDQYTSMVLENIKLVKDGKLRSPEPSSGQSDTATQ
jgi:hypothetical protein